MKKYYVCLIISLFISCFQPIVVNAQKELELNSDIYYMIDLNTHDTVFANNEKEIMYPASMTKIMTAYVVIKNTQSFDKTAQVSADDVINAQVNDMSTIGLMEGEEISVDALLYCMLNASAADAANTLARYIAGTEEEFANIMNQTAKQIGMENTHFTNPSGIHDDDHYTTAEDLALLFEICMENEKFREIIGTDEYILNTNGHHDYEINNYVSLLFQQYEMDSSWLLGAKTGYTPQAGECMVSMGEKDGMKYILVTGKGEPDLIVKSNIQDAYLAYSYEFETNKKMVIANKHEEITLTDGSMVIAPQDIIITVSKNVEEEDLQLQYESLNSTWKGDLEGKFHIKVNEDKEYVINFYKEQGIAFQELMIIVTGIFIIMIPFGVLWYSKKTYNNVTLKKKKAHEDPCA